MKLSPRLLFLLLVFAELAHTGAAIWQHRVPGGHDGFQYFTLQYYFLDNAIQSHDVAQWIPYMTQGTVATLWYGIQGSILQNVLLLVAPLVAHVDLLAVFHLGMFVDEMILLAGTWLLARRFFRTPAAFFIAASVVGSCVWMDQPYWNFRLYYAVPLVLEMGHRFLDTSRWRWLFLAANLLAFQSVGNLPYFIPVTSFVVVAYFAAYAAANYRAVWTQLGALRWRAPALVSLALSMASFAAAYAYLTIGTSSLLNYNAGRGQNGTTDLSGFLSYGGATDLHKWVDSVLNLSPWFDFTLYAGILFAPLVLCGLLALDRRRLHFVVIAAVMLMFTLGTFVSVALFHLWPGMHYFRHIGLVSPLVRVLCCFVAGIGFESLFDAPPPTRPWRVRAGAAAGAVLLVSAGMLALAVAGSGPAMGAYIDRLSDPGVDRPMHTYQPDVLVRRLHSSATMAFAGAAVVGIVPILLSLAGIVRRPRVRMALVAGVLLFVAADVYRFKFRYLDDRSEIVTSHDRLVTRAAPLVYTPRRAANLAQALPDSPRLQATLGFNRVLRQQMQGVFAPGAKYWTNSAFFFVDEAGSSFRVDSWLKPLDQFMRMYWGDPIDGTASAPRGLAFERFNFPLDRPAAAAIAGVSADKIRFFAHAYVVPSEDALVPLMTDASYAGNLLFVLPDTNGGARDAAPEPWLSQQALAADDSRPLTYTVQRFDANHLTLSVMNPGRDTVWMSYADVWHPSWRAIVNDRPVPVYRADMAYKAVPVAAGQNVIRLEFGSTNFSVLAALFSLNALAWLTGLMILISRISRESAEPRI